MPAEGKIDYLELPAADLDAAEAFFAKAFGWTFTDYGPDYRAFNDGRLDGGFYRSDARSTTAAGAALPVIYTARLEDALQRVQDAGGRVLREIFSFPGGRRFHFADPSGNEFAVWSDH